MPRRRRSSSGEPENEDVDMDAPVEIDAANEHDKMKARTLARLALAKRGILRRDEINKRLQITNKNQFQRVFDEAQHRLRDVFGLELAECPRAPKQKGAAMQTEDPSAATPGSGIYVLRSILPNTAREVINPAPVAADESTAHGIMVLLLCVLFCNEGSMREDEMKVQLRKIGFDSDHKDQLRHCELGNLKPYMTTWQKQGYLDKFTTQAPDGSQQNAYRWGPCAKMEFKAEDVIGFMTAIYGDAAAKQDKLERSIRQAAGLSV